jgi:hypothetical protein
LAGLRSEFGVPAYLGSDRRIFQNAGTDDGFGTNRWSRAIAREQAEAAGVNTAGGKYFPGLAEKPGDPKAWCWDTTDVKRRAAEVGADVDFGGREYKAPIIEKPDDTPYEVADDIVEREVAEVVCDDHGGTVSGEKYDEIRYETKERLAGREP